MRLLVKCYTFIKVNVIFVLCVEFIRYRNLNTGLTQKNGAVSIVIPIETAPFVCVCPILGFWKRFKFSFWCNNWQEVNRLNPHFRKLGLIYKFRNNLLYFSGVFSVGYVACGILQCLSVWGPHVECSLFSRTFYVCCYYRKSIVFVI
jgi:hypothetical protein